jgi:gas vesicle structural protein
VGVATRETSGNYLKRAPSPSGLVDVIDLILDKGLVIDAYVRVSVIGIELLTVDARIVVASVDTYLRVAEAVNRLDLTQTELAGLPELQQRVPEEMAEHAAKKAKDKPKQAMKKAEQEPEQLAERAKKKTKNMFEELKDRARGKT